MKILITGSEGFVGSHLVQHALSLGWEVTGCDIRDTATNDYAYTKINPDAATMWTELLASIKPDACINAAGSGHVARSVSHPHEDFAANVAQTAALLDAIYHDSPQTRYIHISSAAVYGNPTQLPVKESDTCKPLSPYGWHKWMAEMLCREYVQLFGLSIAIVRPFSIYGPGLRKQIFWDSYQKWKSDPRRIELWGTGDETRDFIHIIDVCKALFLLIEKSPMQADIYNLASGIETCIREAADMLFRSELPVPELVFNQMTRPADPVHWKADMTALTALGFQTSIPVQQGLGDLWAWLKKDG